MFCTPNDRPGIPLARHLEAVERFRRACNGEKIEGVTARSKAAGNVEHDNARRVYEWYEKNQRGSVATVCESLLISRKSFSCASKKLLLLGLIRRKRLGFYELV